MSSSLSSSSYIHPSPGCRYVGPRCCEELPASRTMAQKASWFQVWCITLRLSVGMLMQRSMIHQASFGLAMPQGVATPLPQHRRVIATPWQCHCHNMPTSSPRHCNAIIDTAVIMRVPLLLPRLLLLLLLRQLLLPLLLLLGEPATTWAFPYVLLKFSLSGGPTASVRNPRSTKHKILFFINGNKKQRTKRLIFY